MFGMPLSAETFLNSHIGDRYRRGAAGPHAWDCWGLTRAVQRELFARELPIVAFNDAISLRALLETFASDENRQGWCELAVDETQQTGDVVTMSKASEEHHIGTWFAFDGGGVFHAIELHGVCFDTLTHLQMQGWRRFRFYRWCAQ
jgi:hypothetical protein